MKAILFLLYGIVAYLVFFGTFCYAAGFVSMLLVPKHIDSVPKSSLGYAFMVDAILLSLFALQHSVMARPAFKQWWTRFVPEPIERSTYVLLASLCLLVLFWYWQPLGGIIWQAESETIQLVLICLCLFGFGVVLKHISHQPLRSVWTAPGMALFHRQRL